MWQLLEQAKLGTGSMRLAKTIDVEVDASRPYNIGCERLENAYARAIFKGLAATLGGEREALEDATRLGRFSTDGPPQTEQPWRHDHW